MKNSVDYRSRFRILKGGKISLVVSALLVGSSLVGTNGYAASGNIGQFFSSPVSFTNPNGTTISISGEDNSIGIYAPNGMTNGDFIINNGTVTATTTDSNLTKGISALGISTGNLSNTASITNSGTITATATATNASTYARGIRVGTLSGTASITNSGTITATSSNNGTNQYANVRGIDTNALNDSSSITNSGTITVSTTGTSGRIVGIYTYGYGAGSKITNSGTISVNGGNLAMGIYDGWNAGTITNSGTISVNASKDSTGISAYQNAGTITNSGTITATINGQADAYGVAIMSSGMGSVTNTATGNLNGNLNIQGTLTNDGHIALPYNATAMVGTFINNGTLGMALLTDGTTTTHSTLSTDTATFNNGSTLAVNVLRASTNEALLVGKTLTDVVTAKNGVTVNGTLSVTDNSALLNFQPVVNTNGIDLNVVQGSTITGSTISGGGSSNTQSSASALQTIQDEGNHHDMDNFFAALNTLGSDAEVAHAVESTTPEGTHATSMANTQIMNGIQQVVDGRQNTTLGNGMNSGDTTLADKNLWVKLYGGRGTQEDKSGINGFNLKSRGLGIGADTEIGDKQRIGMGLFYTNANVNVHAMPQSSLLKVYTAMVYGNLPVYANTDLLYQAGYSWQKTDSSRTVLPTYTNATAEYTAKTTSLDLKLVQAYKMANNVTVHPRIEGTYRHTQNPAYAEGGAGAMNLNVGRFSTSQLIFGGGATMDYKLDQNSKLLTDLGIGYDLHHSAQSVTASYAGASSVSFNTQGIDNGGWNYILGLGYERANVLNGNISLMYNYQAQGSSFTNHTLLANYVYKF